MKKILSGAILLLCLIGCSNSNETKFAQEPGQTNINTTGQTERFIIKASNNMYLVVSPDSLLVANQPNAANAEVFEKVNLGNGKTALKTSKGKFMSDNRSKNSKVDAIRDKAQSWEMFEIIALDQTKVNIKSSQGKFVCADQSQGNFLIANRNKAGEWETFTLENK